MWPFSRKQETSVVAAPLEPGANYYSASSAEVAAATEPTKKEVKCPPFGAHVAGLTRFGNTWINLNELSVIEFEPPDGCGAECYFKGNKNEWHIPEEDALAIRTYLENFEQLADQVDRAQA